MKTVTRENLAALVKELVAKGTAVVAPAASRDGGVDYRDISTLDEARLGEQPRRSLKELFLPPQEPLFSWVKKGSDVTLSEVRTEFPPRVVLGAPPCDAAAVETLDKVMGWDYRDELWFGRRAATTIVALACTAPRGGCFCEEVGLAPDSPRGADLLLRAHDGGYAVEVVTKKGEALVTAHAALFAETPGEAPVRAPAPASDMPRVRAWLESHFVDGLWDEIGRRCHGCGACASVCPTCHCFDIVDEPEGVCHGTRRRHWDTCQTPRFTRHASGHNPRNDQGSRLRQRVMHKFAIYPARFGEVLCTGCGRCSRSCPAGTDLPEILHRIEGLA